MKAPVKLLRNTAAAFLLLQTAGILYAADIPVTTGYTITRDTKKADGTTKKQVCCSFALSVDKVQYNLTVPANSYSGYTAAYEDNSGNWQILKKNSGQTEWNAVTDTTKKGKLAKLFTPVQNQNMEITTTDGTTAELTSAGCIAQTESPALPAEISGQAYEGIKLPTLSGGRFYLAEYGTGTTYLLTFKTSGSFMDLEAEAISKEQSINSKELTKKQISDYMFAWLEATDKSGCRYPALSEKLAEMLAESLIKKDAFDDLYKASGSEYIQLYLQHVYNNSRSIYADGLHEDEPLYNPKAYESIKDTEGERLAEEAKKYLTNGVERGDGKKQNMIYKNSADKEYPSDDSTMNGNPLPYSTDGIDTPETFWYKMKTQADYYRAATTGRSKYYKKLYRPGDIDGGTVAGCGTDSWGLLAGCIKGAGLGESIRYAENGVMKEPAKELSAYAVKIRSDAAGEYGDGSRKNSEAFADMQYDYKGLKETSLIVPYLSKVQPGDILYGKRKAGADEADDRKELIGIITEKGTDSSDPEAFMKGTKVVWMDRKAGCAVSRSWKEFSDAVGDLRCLRLLKNKTTSEKYEHAESWDVFDRTPAGAELEIGSMKEESQVSSERWRWIPNTGEYLVLEKLSIQLKNRSGMKLQPLTGNSYSVTLAGAYDRNYDSTKAGEGNIYNNKAESFDIAFLDEDDTVQCSGKLDKPEVKGDKRVYTFEKTEGTVPVMYADTMGNIYTASGKRVRLGIRPESAESAYPGDDLIPAFTAVYTSLSEGRIKYFDFQAKDSDYLAVYDKKLLWRANLYINKTETALGNMDWNNAHPWTGEEGYGANDWLGTDNSTGDNKGGQGNILSWTRWNDNGQVDKSVAYGWGCWDSVSDFNSKLTAQSSAIAEKRSTDTTYAQLNWVAGQTTAPGTSWHNYLFGQRKIEVGQTTKDGASVNYNYYKYGSAAAGVVQHPYVFTSLITVPGFSTFMAFNGTDVYNINNINNINYASITGNANTPFSGSYHPNQVDYTSGIDCSGLAHICACYSGSNIMVAKSKSSKYGTSVFANSDYTMEINTETWMLDVKDTDPDNTKIKERNIQRVLLTHVVPGDILVISGSHVVIIQNLNYEENEIVMKSYDDVDIIHATQGGLGQKNLWDVQRGVWNDLGNKKSDYQLRRYK